MSRRVRKWVVFRCEIPPHLDKVKVEKAIEAPPMIIIVDRLEEIHGVVIDLEAMEVESK